MRDILELFDMCRILSSGQVLIRGSTAEDFSLVIPQMSDWQSVSLLLELSYHTRLF